MAELATDPQERAEWLTFVVIGAGPTGVELVGQVAELAHKVLPRDYRDVDTREARIMLLEGAPAVLPPFDEKLQRYTHQRLEKMGVEIKLGTLAVGMDERSVTVKSKDGEETIPTRTRIWAAGVQASPLAKLLAEKTGAETDRAGRIAVNPDCTLPGHPEVFAIGDMVSLNKLPGVAQPAMQEGKYVGKVIKARLAGDEKVPAVPVLRQGLDGHHRAPDRGGRRVRDEVHRRDRLHDVGLHPRALPDRLGQPARHHLHLGPRADLLQQPRPPDHHLPAGAPAGRGAARRRTRHPRSGPAEPTSAAARTAAPVPTAEMGSERGPTRDRTAPDAPARRLRAWANRTNRASSRVDASAA